MNKQFRLAAAGLLALCAAGTATAAGKFDENAATHRAVSLLKAHADEGRVSANDSFSLRHIVVDADGAYHVRMSRSYMGLPVLGGDLVVHVGANGDFAGVSLTQRDALKINTVPALSAQDAIAFAEKQFVGSKEGVSTAKLAVYARGEAPVLVYDVVVRGFAKDMTPSEKHFIVAADKARVIESWDDVHTTASTGTGNSLFAGTIALDTDKVSTSSYELLDSTRGSHYTVDMNNGTRSRTITDFVDADNVWGNGTTSSDQSAAVDAHWGAAKTWDFYKTLGRNGIANDGDGAYSRVHYSTNYVNAYWSDSCFCMTYGDGDGKTYAPLVTLDVAGHEMTHGVTSVTAGLTYSGESGGLNEAMSDIMGTMVEYYANNAKEVPNYLIGERIYYSNAGVNYPTKALRYMFKPSLDGLSPDCWSSTLKNLDVHYSSGVGNHFFYLLAEGATVPTGFSMTTASLVCNGNTALTAIGRDAATKIMYRALTVYMTSSTTYAGARTATLNAAKDLYGTGSTQYNAVAAAWSAVSVN